jgi:hypothetical protein
MAQKYIILLNGPKEARPDLAATIIGSYLRNRPGFSYTHESFMAPVYLATHTLFGIPNSRSMYVADDPKWEETPTNLFFGYAPIEAYSQVECVLDRIGGAYGEASAHVLSRKVYRETVSNVFGVPDCETFDQVWPICMRLTNVRVMLIELHHPEQRSWHNYVGDKCKSDPRTKDVVVRKIYDVDDRDAFSIMIKGAVKSFLKLED